MHCTALCACSTTALCGTLLIMSINNKEFIARHQTGGAVTGTVKPKSQKRRNRVMCALMLLLSLGMIVFAVMIALNEQSSFTMIAISVGLAALVAFLSLWGSLSQKKQDGELSLIRSVIEGSRGARLITDSADNTVLTNGKLDELCKGLGPPSFKTLIRLFENNEEALAHFRLLADQAHRGLTDSLELFSKVEDHERWFSVTAQPVAGWAGYVHWRIDDVTDKYTVDRAIRDEREKLIDFTDNAPVGFFSVNEEGRFVFANATFARWLGEDLQTILSTARLHTYLVAPPENAAPYDLIEDGGARQVVELKMKGTAGKTFLASINQVVVTDSKGYVRTRGVVHDLTAERAMRQALQVSEDRFLHFFEEAPLGILFVNKDAEIQDCNASFAAMLDLDINDIEHKNFASIISEDDHGNAIKALSRIGQGQQTTAPLEVSLIGASQTLETGEEQQTIIETQMHARRFKESDDIVLHFIDLREQKALEAQFAQSQKMQAVGQLAGGVAHDFNNLLTAMIGFCDLLLLRHKPGDPSFSDIMQIKQNSNRASNLVRQLLAFSRQQTLRPKIHDLTDILNEASHLLRRLIGANVELDFVYAQELGLVKVDEGQMDQVLINLVVNARDAMVSNGGNGEGSGKITITTKNFTNRKPKELLTEEMPPGHWVLIEVSDTGCGITKDNMTRIFEPFFTTKGVGEGTGLGLATVYGIIRQTGGFLDVNSKLNQGTTFTIYLPRTHDSDEEIEDEADDDKPRVTQDLTGSERILLVEDEEAVRSFAQRALTNKGYEVLTAESGEAALDLMAEQENKHLDLLLTDVVMPGIDGPTMAKKMREDAPKLKIIFMSGYTEDRLKDHMGEGIYFLPKPFTLKGLAEKIKDVLND